jgi:hypothetical protein
LRGKFSHGAFAEAKPFLKKFSRGVKDELMLVLWWQACRLDKTSCRRDGCLYKKEKDIFPHVFMSPRRELFRKKSPIAGGAAIASMRCAVPNHSRSRDQYSLGSPDQLASRSSGAATWLLITSD